MRLLFLRIPARVALLALVVSATCLVAAQKTASPASKAPAQASPVSYADIAQSAGLDFHLTCGSPEKRYIMESMCGGIAFVDFDNDGWMDIFLVNGSTLQDLHAGRCHPGKLYRNQHDGTFKDVSTRAGIARCGWGFGVAAGDYDNDGFVDLYITYLDGGALYHNNKDGTFTDVTQKSGAANAGAWGTSAAFGDYDNDGLLDLYIANYVALDLEHLPAFGEGPNCQYRGIPVSCGPRGLKGARDRLYHNNGDGTFTDVTEKLGIDTGAYYGLGVLWLDYDQDGCLDLYVADDSSPSMLYHNNCKGGFEEVGVEAGVAYSGDGREQAGMGIDAADYDHDRAPDIAKTNFSDDSNNLYRNDGKGQFTDAAGPASFGPISIPFLGFGLKFLDFDNDSWPDVFIANGHVNPQVDQHSFGVTYAERPLLFHNLQNGRFAELGEIAGPAMRKRYVARGAATADLMNDGSQYILLSVLDSSPALLRPEVKSPGNWLRIKLVGHKSNREGLGARVEVAVGATTLIEEARANSSFESASDPRVHIGLGRAKRADAVIVHWPSGVTDRLGPVQANREVVIEEGQSAPSRIGKLPAASDPRLLPSSH